MYVHVLHVCSGACVLVDTHVHVCVFLWRSEADCFPQQRISHWTWTSLICEANQLLNSGHWSLSPPGEAKCLPLTWLSMRIWDPNLCLNSAHTALWASAYSQGRILSSLLSLLILPQLQNHKELTNSSTGNIGQMSSPGQILLSVTLLLEKCIQPLRGWTPKTRDL